MRKIQPLTPKEQLYAEKHHEMIYHFLSHYQLDETEYYDVVVFGYLAAIQEYIVAQLSRQKSKIFIMN